MDAQNSKIAELERLFWQLRDGAIDDAGLTRLESLVTGDAETRRFYIRYNTLCGGLRWLNAGDQQRGAGDLGFGDLGIGDSGLGVGDSGFGIRDFNVPNLQISKSPNQQIPPLPTTHYPLSTPFVGGPVFSYIAATLILGVMLLGAWAYKISHDYGTSLATNSRGLTAPGGPAQQRPEPIFVARVTGMKDCRWADPQTETYAGAAVPLGRKYSLSSGLMEITYLSGAKVILEGPCRYEVESAAGGFLALGKLTAKVEKRSEVGGQRSEIGGRRSEPGGLAASAASVQPQASITPNPSPKPQAPRPKTEISKSPHLQISKFSVRTPTALVTDLGTEFGVEVAANGDTTSHVFQGRVMVRAGGPAASVHEGLAASAASGAGQITLVAGQSARVEKDADTGETRITTDQQAGAVPKFVRRMYEPLKLLDLLDIVAGGNGLSGLRNSGIDPATGRREAYVADARRTGDGQFRPVVGNRLIDGVFIPDGRLGPVQVDSAGGTFDGFPETLGRSWGPLWVRGFGDPPPGPDDDPNTWIHLMDGVERFSPARRGLLCLHANAAITFNLEAVRGRLRGTRPERFQATAGMIGTSRRELDFDGVTDVWVIVDGRLKMKRAGLGRKDGALAIDVELAPADRFLTLAATDGGDGITSDWVVFGDPALKLSSAGQKEDK